jgi:prevent-host-death family protein
MDKIIPISDLQVHAKKYVDMVKNTSDPVVVTQRGRAAVVIVSYDEYEGLKATQLETSFPDWRRRLDRAERELKSGKSVSLETLLRRRRAAA